jgi:hypothetical protein
MASHQLGAGTIFSLTLQKVAGTSRFHLAEGSTGTTTQAILILGMFLQDKRQAFRQTYKVY